MPGPASIQPPASVATVTMSCWGSEAGALEAGGWRGNLHRGHQHILHPPPAGRHAPGLSGQMQETSVIANRILSPPPHKQILQIWSQSHDQTMRSPFQFDAESCCRSFKALSRFPHFDGCLDVFTKLWGDHKIWEWKWKLKQNNSVMRQYTKVIIMEQFDNNYIAWFMTFKTHIQFKQKGYLYLKPK